MVKWTTLRIISTSLLATEYLILLLWAYNAITYKVGRHRIIEEGWLERNQQYDVLNNIGKPFAWSLIILLPLTIYLHRHLPTDKKILKTIIAILIPTLLIIGLLTYEYFLLRQYEYSIEFNG